MRENLPHSRQAPPAVEAQGLCRRYGRTWALAGVDLRVERGVGLLVAGRNGSGKSTLLRVLAGALRPDLGSLRIDGRPERDEIKRRTGLLGHASYTYEPLSAVQNLAVFTQMLGLSSNRDALMARLAQVGMGEHADKPVHSFSAGMRKRLALARTLLQEPAVLLLDEPYGQLDPEGFKLLDELAAAARARGSAVIIASHELARAARLCDQAVVLERGRVRWRGPSRELVGGSAFSATLGLSADASPSQEVV